MFPYSVRPYTGSIQWIQCKDPFVSFNWVFSFANPAGTNPHARPNPEFSEWGYPFNPGLSFKQFYCNNSTRILYALAALYSSAFLSFKLRRCLAAFIHKYSIPIFWPTWILATTYSSNPTQNFSTGQQVRATSSWAIHVRHSTFCSPTLAAPGLSVNFYMSLKSQLYGPLHLSELFFLQLKEDFANFDPLNANILDFHARYIPHCRENASVS